MSAPSDQPLPPAEPDPRGERVAAAVKTWQRHLVDLGGRNTLLWYRDLPSGTLDLTNAHPGGLAMLLAGRPTKLSDLVREPAALDDARRRARTIRAKSVELLEERGIAVGFIAIGMATWTIRGAGRAPAAPVLLRSCVLRPTGAAREDFTLDLGDDVELNPVLEHYLRSEQGIDVDSGALEDLATAGGAFDPIPVYAALTRLCASVPDFVVSPRLVVGTFSYAKLPMVADLAAQGPALADHDVVAALAGDPGALRAVRSEVPQSPVDADPAHELLVLDADSSQQAAIDAVRSGAHLVIKGPPGTGKSQTIANLIATLAGEGKRVLFVAEKRAAIDAVLSRLDQVGLGDLVLDAYDGASNKRRLAREFGQALEQSVQTRDPDTGELERALVDRRRQLVDHAAALHEVREPWGVSAHQAQEAISRLSAEPHPPTSRVRLRGEQLAGLSRQRVDELGRQLTEAASLGAWAGSNDSAADEAPQSGLAGAPTDGSAKGSATGSDPEGGAAGADNRASASAAGRDPWFGARIATTDEAVRARDITARLAHGGLDEVAETMREVFAEVELPEATRPTDWGDVLDTVGRVRDTLEVFRPEVFDLPLGELVAATGSAAYRKEHGTDLGWWSRWRLRSQARSLLRPGTPPADLHAALADAQTQRTAWQQMAGAGGRPEIPVDLDRARTAYRTLAEELTWLGSRLATTSEGGALLESDLPTLRRRLAELAATPERLTVVPRVLGTLDALREAGLGPLVDELADRGVAADDVARELEFVWWASLSDDLIVRDPRYGAHDGAQLQRVAREYVAADRAHLQASAGRVRAGAGRRLREVLADHPEQEALVRAEAGKSRRHKALRDLLPLAGETLTAIKPAWAMSPLVVASVLPPGRWFDVVVFDEASQIPPAQAVSAISRAGQVVVAGDERQLPPTSFFTSAVDDEASGPVEDEALTEGFESVLDVLTAALPTRRLSWHYRSLDERLVAFANREMYDGSLVTFPGTGTEPVVRLEAVDGAGVVQPGEEAIESTEVEVDRVVELVLDHARTRPDESLGVIALGIKHAARIDEALRRALAAEANADVAEFFDEDRPERFFVKNLERVQGDERDAIILAIGYGKTPHGRVLHRFGPLNLEGGERRLNVAITRARRRMTVVSSLVAADLDPSRLKARGAQMLRDFLAYAADPASAPIRTSDSTSASASAADASAGAGADTARPSVTHPNGRSLTSVSHPNGTSSTPDPLRAEFAERLRKTGLVVHEAFGSQAHPIDLAVEDPDRPGSVLVAVETDGAAYAAMPSTRDRDRLRGEQLGRLGWMHVRVWSTDLFRDPARDVARVHSAVQQAVSARNAAESIRAASRPEPADAEPAEKLADPANTERSSGQEPENPSPSEPSVTDQQVVSDAQEQEPAAAEPEFTPEPDQKARQRRIVRGRKRKAKPDQTRDDTDEGWGERPDDAAHERWLREQRPPHWGRD